MPRITEQRDVKDFHSVDLRGTGTVTLVQGDDEGLTITAEERTMPHITAEVVRGVLRIGMDASAMFGVAWRPGQIDYQVAIRDVRSLAVSGAGKIRSERVEGDQLELGISGSGSIGIDDVAARVLSIGISGSGDLDIGGAVERTQLDVSGSGKLRAERLGCGAAKIKISGSGHATLQVRDVLDVQITGSGNVRYIGNPAVDVKKTGVGRVSQVAAS